ncbi:MAG: class I SAM-dependent methyltransferase [Treponema sp.]|jgi:23S rRNA G2069 N7-methylase RlmK/C1962 C5-methylase RlmI|nr:class I SAM-dependent methyltransferase [Treponema sp.]
MERSDQKTACQAEMLFNRLTKRQRHLMKWAARTGTDAFRLYDRDIPEIPLRIDRYNDAVCGALFERPYDTDADEEARWLMVMTDAVAQALSIPADRIFLKIRKRQRGGSQYSRFVHQNFFVDVHEYGYTFRTNLSDYLDTGLFLDRRKLRHIIQRDAATVRGGTRTMVLNLFCYTAAFSVYALHAGGAVDVDSVDLSNTYLDWAKVNCALNGIRAELLSQEAVLSALPSVPCSRRLPPCRLIRADALRFIDEAVRRKRRWDIIILDPPTFSNSKTMRSDFDVNRDHHAIITKCLTLLGPGGALYFSTNARRFNLTGAGLPARYTCRNITEQARDEDFRGKTIPACWVFTDPSC